MILVIGLRLEDHSVIFLTTQTRLSGRHLLAVDFPGLRRNGSWSLVYANGIGLAISAGSISFVRNDRFTFSVTNTEGTFSAFYRRRFQFQLPTDGAGGQTIQDSLAQ